MKLKIYYNFDILTFSVMALKCILYNKVLLTEACIFGIIDDVEKLLHTQKHVIESLTKVISGSVSDRDINDNDEILMVQRFLDKCILENAIAQKNVSLYLDNPINAFTLVKRLSLDLNVIENYYKRHEDLFYPTHKHTYQAVKAVLTLAYVYSLGIEELANGSMVSYAGNKKEVIADAVSPLSSTDCYILAATAFYNKEFKMSIELTEQAILKYDDVYCRRYCKYKKSDLVEFVNQRDVLLGLHQLEYSESNKALEQNNNLVNPFNIALFADYPNSIRFKWDNDNGELCLKGGKRASLHCEYRRGPHPFLRLARLRAELLHTSPEIVLFRDVISDAEIQAVLDKADPIKKCESCNLGINLFRFITYLRDSESRVVAALSQRSLDISGMESALAESYKVLFYGMGGFHKPHVDLWNSAKILPARATVLYFLSTVKRGGATIFPLINLAVFPVKNAALYWRTSDQHDNIDRVTRHAACPVLIGNKKAASKWLSDPLHKGAAYLRGLSKEYYFLQRK